MLEQSCPGTWRRHRLECRRLESEVLTLSLEGWWLQILLDAFLLQSVTEKLCASVKWSQKSLSALRLHSTESFDLKNLSFPPSTYHLSPIAYPQSANNQSSRRLLLVFHLLEWEERGMLLPHVLLFILDAFQRAEEKREGRRGPPCRISFKYYCPSPYVGTGPKHSRQSACGKTWTFCQLESSKGQIKDLEFKRETNKMN